MADQLKDSDQVRRFWQSPRVEGSLLFYDIDSSLAHIRMLGDTGIVESETVLAVTGGLEQIRRELSAGGFSVQAGDVDIHMALERRLSEIVGDASQALRIAKSRNDQIATDIRLWLRDAVFDVFAHLLSLRKVLIYLTERDIEVVMPGYTHMQPAMPILLSHWWLAHESRFRRDFNRLIDFYTRVNVLPLGACALAGTDRPIDRSLVARYLSFDGIVENSLDAVSDRDYLVEFGSFATLVATHVSQLSGELLLWSTQEFGFARLRKAFVFGSLSMPQKRNPELLEILRSRPSAIAGHLIEFVYQLKALPMGFSQDLQESLPGLLDIVDHLKFILELECVLLMGMEFDAGKMKQMALADLTNASNAMDFLTARGVMQEKAAKIVELLVNYCNQRNKYLSDLALSEWQQFSPVFDLDIYKHVTIEESVGSRQSFGGTSKEQVMSAFNRATEVLALDCQRLPAEAVSRFKEKDLCTNPP